MADSNHESLQETGELCVALVGALKKIGIKDSERTEILKFFQEQFERLSIYRKDGVSLADSYSQSVLNLANVSKAGFCLIKDYYFNRRRDSIFDRSGVDEVIDGMVSDEGAVFPEHVFDCEQKIEMLELMLRYMFSSKTELMKDEFFYELFQCALQIAYEYYFGGYILDVKQLEELMLIMAFSVTCATSQCREGASSIALRDGRRVEYNFPASYIRLCADISKQNFKNLTGGKLVFLLQLDPDKAVALTENEKARLAELLCGELRQLCDYCDGVDTERPSDCVQSLMRCYRRRAVELIIDRHIAIVDLAESSLGELKPYFSGKTNLDCGAGKVLSESLLFCYVAWVIECQLSRKGNDDESYDRDLVDLGVVALCFAKFTAKEAESRWSLYDIVGFWNNGIFFDLTSQDGNRRKDATKHNYIESDIDCLLQNLGEGSYINMSRLLGDCLDDVHCSGDKLNDFWLCFSRLFLGDFDYLKIKTAQKGLCYEKLSELFRFGKIPYLECVIAALRVHEGEKNNGR